jgi:receptor protein-tyrosine kinase
MTTDDRTSLVRRWWLPMVLAAAVGVAAGIALSMTTRTTYVATTTSFVSLASRSAVDGDPFAGSQFVLQRMDTYAGLATTSDVLDTVIDRLGLPLTAAQLRGEVSSTTPPNSVLLSVVVRDANRSRAAMIADAVAAEQARAVERAEAVGGGQDASPVRVTVIDSAVVEPASLLSRPVSVGLTAVAAALLVLVVARLRRRYVDQGEPVRNPPDPAQGGPGEGGPGGPGSGEGALDDGSEVEDDVGQMAAS